MNYSLAKRITIAFKVTEATAHELRGAASRDERSVSGYLRKLVEKAIEDA